MIAEEDQHKYANIWLFVGIEFCYLPLLHFACWNFLGK